MMQARGKRQNVKKGFFMTKQEQKTVDFIYNVTAAAVCVIVGVTLALAYFDVLTK